MKCPTCGRPSKGFEKSCASCGSELVEGAQSSTMSLAQWTQNKARAKDEAKKEQVRLEKERLKAIEERMYGEQDNFEVDSMFKKDKKKDPKDDSGE